MIRKEYDRETFQHNIEILTKTAAVGTPGKDLILNSTRMRFESSEGQLSNTQELCSNFEFTNPNPLLILENKIFLNDDSSHLKL